MYLSVAIICIFTTIVNGAQDGDSDTTSCVCTTDVVPVCCKGSYYSNICKANCDGYYDRDCVSLSDSSTECGSSDVGCFTLWDPYCCNGMTLSNACKAWNYYGYNVTTDCEPDECPSEEDICCDPADRSANSCFEGCACCPDGSWTGSWGDGKSYTCDGVDLVKGKDEFGTVCNYTTTTGIYPIHFCVFLLLFLCFYAHPGTRYQYLF